MPPGTRTSLYENPEYQKAAPFAKMTLESINAADPNKPAVKPVPYVGVQFVAIPGIPGPRHGGRAGVLGGTGRSDDAWTRRLPAAQQLPTAK